MRVSRSLDQGYFGKWAFGTVGHKILLLQPAYGSNIIIQVKVIPESNCKYMDFYPEVGGWFSTE